MKHKKTFSLQQEIDLESIPDAKWYLNGNIMEIQWGKNELWNHSQETDCFLLLVWRHLWTEVDCLSPILMMAMCFPVFLNGGAVCR